MKRCHFLRTSRCHRLLINIHINTIIVKIMEIKIENFHISFVIMSWKLKAWVVMVLFCKSKLKVNC
jgi:hypothetical protein